VFAGRETLLRAAVDFRQVDESPADYAKQYDRLFPGRSVGERLCREVMTWVIAETKAASPDKVAAVTARLEAELQEHMRAHNGMVESPIE